MAVIGVWMALSIFFPLWIVDFPKWRVLWAAQWSDAEIHGANGATVKPNILCEQAVKAWTNGSRFGGRTFFASDVKGLFVAPSDCLPALPPEVWRARLLF